MKKSKFTEEQIIFALKQAELGTSVLVCRKMGISEATFYIWKKIWRSWYLRAEEAPSARGGKQALKATSG